MQRTRLTLLFALAVGILFSGCVGDDFIDDFVQPGVRIMNPADTLALGSTYQFEATYFNGVGIAESASLTWTSSNPEIISITEDGLAEALLDGSSLITVTSDTDPVAMASKNVATGENTVLQPQERTGSLQTTSSYDLEGDFKLHYVGSQLALEFESNYFTSDNLPGLYVYLTNNPSTTSGAFEIGAVSTFEGSHTYYLPESVGLYDYSHVLYYCAPFNVKVGDGAFID